MSDPMRRVRSASFSAQSCGSDCRSMCSVASRLPGADSSVMLSNSRSCASGGRYTSSPSAIHAVGCVGSNPAARSAAGQSSRRSIADGPAVGRRSRAEVGQGAGLELDHLGLVDLVHHGAGRPRQSVGAGVEPGGQDDGLTNAGSGGLGEEVVEIPCADGDLLIHRSRFSTGSSSTSISPSISLHECVEADRAHQRVGQRIVQQRVGALEAIAREAATAVAVAPTLEARSQVSPSFVRVCCSWSSSLNAVAVTAIEFCSGTALLAGELAP